MIEQFCEVFFYRLRKTQADAIKPCINGSIRNMEEYKYITGRVKGLETAEELLKDLFNDVCEGRQIYKEKLPDDLSIELYTVSRRTGS